MKAPLHTRPVTNNTAHTNNKCQCQSVAMAYVGVKSHYVSLTLPSVLNVIMFLHLSMWSTTALRKSWLFGKSDVNTNDWGHTDTFGLMLISLHIAQRALYTLIWSLTSKDKQWCKSALAQSMSFLEVIPPHVHLHGREGENRELGNQIYWHFFKGDSWWEKRGKDRKSVSLFTC